MEGKEEKIYQAGDRVEMSGKGQVMDESAIIEKLKGDIIEYIEHIIELGGTEE